MYLHNNIITWVNARSKLFCGSHQRFGFDSKSVPCFIFRVIPSATRRNRAHGFSRYENECVGSSDVIFNLRFFVFFFFRKSLMHNLCREKNITKRFRKTRINHVAETESLRSYRFNIVDEYRFRRNLPEEEKEEKKDFHHSL